MAGFREGFYLNWRYESDGDIGHRTHYVWRWTELGECERIDFASKKEAKEFLKSGEERD